MTEQNFAPPSTGLALFPGVLLLFVGLWMVSDHGPLALGWACVSIGFATTLVGAVALGTAWGLEIDHRRRR